MQQISNVFVKRRENVEKDYNEKIFAEILRD